MNWKVESRCKIYIHQILFTFAAFLGSSFLSNHSCLAEEFESNADFGDLSLEDLMKVKITGGTKENKTLQETPANATLITSEEIRKSGARDLIDVLNLVPGINLATDTQGVVSISIRGIWAHEGKVLLLIDGEEMNEISFSTIQLGNHYPVNSLDRIEVIRGPGSATHGGYAELAVINLVTKDADQLDGLVAQGFFGQMNNTYAQQNMSLGFGKKIGDWKITGYTLIGRGNRSDRSYTDSNGSTYNLSGNSNLNPNYLNLGLSNNRFKLRFIYDNYNTTDQSAYGSNAAVAVNNNFESFLFGATYELPISNSLTLTPELHLKQNSPWNSTNPQSLLIPQLFYNVRDQELRADLTLRAVLDEHWITYLGVEGRVQRATDYQPGSTFSNGTNEIVYYRNAAFTEIDYTPSKQLSFTLGGRYEGQNAGGNAIVPRISGIGTLGNAYLKLIYSWGFRVPGIENLRYNPSIMPETTKVAEVEIGYNITQTMLATLNFYDILLVNPIIYGYASGSQTYQNNANVSTYGLEADYRIKEHWGYFDINYSYFSTLGDEPIDYRVPGHPETLLGMANHKIAATVNFRLFDDFTHLNFSEMFLSTRYGYDYDSTSTTGLSIKAFNPCFLSQIYLERSDLLIKGLTFGLGVYNLLNQDFRWIQPYDGGHPPIPSPSRDWVLKLAYQMRI